MQLRQGNIPLSDVSNYRDVSMTDIAVCDTGLQMCRQSLYNHEDEILSKGMVFNTMSEMKLFLQDYAVYHHGPYTVTHLDRELRYHVICKNGFSCIWRLNARKR
jgi:lipocalin